MLKFSWHPFFLLDTIIIIVTSVHLGGLVMSDTPVGIDPLVQSMRQSQLGSLGKWLCTGYADASMALLLRATLLV